MKYYDYCKRILRAVLVPLTWILLWQLASLLVSKKLLFPSPLDVLVRIVLLIPQRVFWLSIFNTLSRIFLGFVSAVALGTLLAAATALSALLRGFLGPALSVIKSTPVASFTILALIWIKSSQLSTFISFIMVLPVIYENVYQGVTNIDKNLTEMAHVFRVSPFRRILNIHVHSVKPFLYSAASAGLGFAWKSGVAAEVIGLPNNTVGMRLYEAKISLETADLFAWTIVVILISAAMERIFIRIIKNI